MKILFLILMSGVIGGLYYIFVQSKKENIYLRLAAALFCIFNLCGAIYCINKNLIQIPTAYIRLYLLITTLIFIYGGHLKSLTQSYEERKIFRNHILKFMIAMIVYALISFKIISLY
ncbi:hypothetical protein [uncultured Phascolarctobacterium sp.]|uniref:hypothetical protein n=1 Tax=uncultured Phascolarctobacterium sp. TaxID=512296 RepID=UPI0026373009|nr:hypothetical protein [uncultured Phascolarctobacterium sp.]